MRAFHAFWASGLLAALAIVAVMIVHGGWEAGAAGIAIVAGGVCLLSLIVLGIESDAAPE